MTAYEIVVGLEVHVELATASKIFCGCTTEFGGDPNTHVCPVCTGMPGVLPVLNKKVLEFAIRVGLALDCAITRYGKFDRKNYFYPDLPKAYQTSQLFLPICTEGFLDIATESGSKRIGIHEIHMEEDAGKLIHDPWEDCTHIDYNRCGVPLIEIVSEPDFRSGEEVVAYLERLRELLLYIGVSDCKMQEGSMRADINLSVRPVGSQQLGTRTEMKNMNSLKMIQRAVECEAQRQIELIEAGGKVVQETRRWDDNKDSSFAMRSKENAQDYRYFPEPDLLPMSISEEWIAEIAREMPEFAHQKRERFISQFEISDYDAQMITSEKPLCDLFERLVQETSQPKESANLIIGEIMRLLNKTGQTAEELRIDPLKLAKAMEAVLGGFINRNGYKEVIEAVFTTDADPLVYIQQKGLAMIGDEEQIKTAVMQALELNPKSVEDYAAGKEKAFGFLVGQIMRVLKGKADPQIVNRILKEMLP